MAWLYWVCWHLPVSTQMHISAEKPSVKLWTHLTPCHTTVSSGQSTATAAVEDWGWITLRFFHEIVDMCFGPAAINQHNSVKLNTIPAYLENSWGSLTGSAMFAFAQLMAQFLPIIICEIYLSHHESGTRFCYFSLLKFKQKLSASVWLSIKLVWGIKEGLLLISVLSKAD